MNKKLVLLAFQLSAAVFYGQTVSGVVVDADNKTPLSGVKIAIENTGIWTSTDKSGKFEIKYNPNEVLVFSKAGLLIEKRTFTETPSQPIGISMNVATIRIKEITLTPRKKNYSEIEIREEALKNIQAFSLNEVLEQIPGQKLQNLNLNEFKPIVFRSVVPTSATNEGFGNKSFGTAIVVDGIPISNNENMQSYTGNYSPVPGTPLNPNGQLFSPNTIGFGTGSNYFSNSNFGVDLREIPVENIESVEVVQGIPSARFGDLTSGLVNVQQKSGKTPYRFYVALREGVQEYNFNKGFSISEKGDAINVNLNYLNSNADPRSQFNVYERVATNLMWTTYNKKKNLTNTVSLDYSTYLDNVNKDLEDVDEKIVKNEKRDFSISNRLNWRIKKSWIDNVLVNANYRQGYQNSYSSRLYNSGGEVVGTSITEGVFTGVYSPPSYRYVEEVEGKPISMFFSAEAKKNLKTSKSWIHNFVVGTSYRNSDNKGRGRLGSPETLLPIFVGSGQAFRPYNFGDNVRAESQFSVYAEDNIFKKFGNNIFNMNLGLRYDNQVSKSMLQPRVNAYLIHKNIKFRGGFGIASKAPSMNMIYTGERYYDVILADLRLPGYYNMGIVQTFKDQADNKHLKPSRSIRSEVGIDYKFSGGFVGLTGYYNVLKDGFTIQSDITKRNLATLQITTNGTNLPTYDVIGFTNLYYPLNKIVNSLESKDTGLEFMSAFNKLPVNNFSLDVNASYVKTTNNPNTEYYYRSKNVSSDEKYGVFNSYDKHYQQFIVGGALNYHLPKAGLVVTLRSQHYIVDEYNFNANRNPYAYLDANLNKVLLTEEQINDPSQFAHIKYAGNPAEEEKITKVYHNFNLKISKDFKNGFRFSFYANNFLDLKQTEVERVNGVDIKTVKSDLLTLSFGAKIEYQF